MNSAVHSTIVNFIWSIADEALKDVFVRGKYRDIILPMTVIRRFDTVLEPTQKAVIAAQEKMTEAGVTAQDPVLRKAAQQAFYNTSSYTLSDCRIFNTPQQLRTNFVKYLDGFSPNVQEIMAKFQFRNNIEILCENDILNVLIEKFLSPNINLSPQPVYGEDHKVKLPALDNHAMGTIFEELIRRFNEADNESSGEHFTPRDAVNLMADLVFLPIASKINSGTYLIYDGACGTGGMLTVAEERLQKIAAEHNKEVDIHLYGQELQGETFAIAKADMLLKGSDDTNAENIKNNSTLSQDAFPDKKFDFMLSNPPYGKNWQTDLRRLNSESADPRFVVQHKNEPEYSMMTRANDGQMMFLLNMLAKMKTTREGSRIAEIHNGSSLFTGDAGQGESNIRRRILENDWLEAIIALPLNMFYNTGIATYIWVLTNKKPNPRRGKTQLIDATQWAEPLRKNLGKKNSQLGEEAIARICKVFMDFRNTPHAKIFNNQDFGYYKVAVNRPLRLAGAEADREYSPREIQQMKRTMARDMTAPPLICTIHPKGVAAAPLHGRFGQVINGKRRVVEYEPDKDLADTEQVPLAAKGGIDEFMRREVLPFAPDAWYDKNAVKIGYEINFNRHFYRPQKMRALQEIRRDIVAAEKESKGLLVEIVGGKF